MRSDSFRAAAEAKDFGAADDLFAEDVTFRSPAPAVETATTRELLWSSVMPSDASSRVTAFDTLAFDRPSAAAAAVKLPPSATATKQAQPS